MKIFACLGNPGQQYRKNRHNIGFITGDYIRGIMQNPVNKRHNSFELFKGKVFDTEITLLYPTTFMNNSGKAVSEYLRFVKAGIEDLAVIHDELELAFGKVSLKEGGGHKGHNGVRSIISEIGSSDFTRIRMGIGRPDGPIGVADYVLSNFTVEEETELEKMIQNALVLIEGLVKK